MSLKEEPGENVDKITTKMGAKIRILEGANRFPADIGQIVCKALMSCSVIPFALEFTQLYNEFEKKPKKHTYTTLFRMASASYRSNMDRNM